MLRTDAVTARVGTAAGLSLPGGGMQPSSPPLAGHRGKNEQQETGVLLSALFL